MQFGFGAAIVKVSEFKDKPTDNSSAIRKGLPMTSDNRALFLAIAAIGLPSKLGMASPPPAEAGQRKAQIHVE